MKHLQPESMFTRLQKLLKTEKRMKGNNSIMVIHPVLGCLENDIS